jgi:hypothetical protein
MPRALGCRNRAALVIRCLDAPEDTAAHTEERCEGEPNRSAPPQRGDALQWLRIHGRSRRLFGMGVFAALVVARVHRFPRG